MKGLDNPAFLVLYAISNLAAVLLLITAWKAPRTARIMLFLLFAWAGWTNWDTVMQSPHVYLGEAELTFFTVYQRFIAGWFSRHITETVSLIATCQLLIAASMLLRGWVFKTGAVGAIIFLVAIAPFGVGSAFPCTILVAAALLLLLANYNHDYIWKGRQSVTAKNALSREGSL